MPENEDIIVSVKRVMVEEFIILMKQHDLTMRCLHVFVSRLELSHQRRISQKSFGLGNMLL